MKSRTYNLAAAEMQEHPHHKQPNSATSRSNPTYFLNADNNLTGGRPNRSYTNGSYPTPSEKGDKFAKLPPHRDDDDFALTSCGLGSWRPAWLQAFASPVFFLLNMSFVGVIQGMTGPLFFSCMSTLEKRYAFDSRVSGIILIADNFSQMLISPLVGYIGLRFNRSRVIGMGEIVLALSCFMTAAPYFIYGPGSHLLSDTALLSALNRTHIEYCSASSEPYDCIENKGATVWPAVFILFIGSFFRGIGFTAFFVIGFPYLDDNVSKKSSPMYLSIMQAIRLIGPASGYLLSSFCLRYYENPLIDPGITRKDPRFIGAWWLSFCIVGALLFIAALPMLLFPMQFKTASVKASEMKEKIKKSGGGRSAFMRFLTNPIIILYLVGSSFRYIGIGGYVMLKTKYIESQFRQSSSASSLITGTTSIMPMAIGILSGGIMISIFRPGPRFIFIYVFIVEAVSIFTFGSGMFLGCDPIKLVGGAWDSLNGYAPSAGCNSQCACTTHVFMPMCAADGRSTYFSPCYAGCATYGAVANSSSLFSDCSCFAGNPTPGYCSSDTSNCNNLFTYLTVMMSGAIISSTSRTANSLISFRSVDPMDKGFTMGMASSFMAIFAFIPYPLIFGYIADSVCLVWEEKCGKRGNCWLYDQEKFRKYLHGGTVTFLLLGSLFDFILIFFSGRVKNFYDDDDEPASDRDGNTTIDSKLALELKEQSLTIATIAK